MTDSNDTDAPSPNDRASRADLVGVIVGAGVGVLAGPLVGGGAGWLAKELAEDLQHRLGKLSATRAADAVQAAAREDARLNDAGQPPRDDGFFDPRGDERPVAHEVLEGVLLQAANAFEEKKVPYLGRLYAGIAHDATVTGAQAHYLVRTAGDLTYRQLVALAVFARARTEHAHDLAGAISPRGLGHRRDDHEIQVELEDLASRGLVAVDRTGPATLSTRVTLTPSGAALYRLMGLVQISLDERDAWIARVDGPILGEDITGLTFPG